MGKGATDPKIVIHVKFSGRFFCTQLLLFSKHQASLNFLNVSRGEHEVSMPFPHLLDAVDEVLEPEAGGLEKLNQPSLLLIQLIHLPSYPVNLKDIVVDLGRHQRDFRLAFLPELEQHIFGDLLLKLVGLLDGLPPLLVFVGGQQGQRLGHLHHVGLPQVLHHTIMLPAKRIRMK